jgi:PPOX class probable F420-dependent enzyme
MAEPAPIPEHCQQILADAVYGTLTTIRHKDGLPSTNPVAYVWDGEQVRISTLKSRVKYRNLAANPAMAFCVVSPQDLTQYVELRGHATLADDPDRSFFREQFKRGMGGAEPPPDLDPPDAERVVITLHPQQVSSPTLYGGRLSTAARKELT